MNPLNNILVGASLEDIEQLVVERVIVPVEIQDQVERSGPKTVPVMPSRPVLRGVSPETPNLRGRRGDFEPVVADEEEVVRLLI